MTNNIKFEQGAYSQSVQDADSAVVEVPSDTPNPVEIFSGNPVGNSALLIGAIALGTIINVVNRRTSDQ